MKTDVDGRYVCFHFVPNKIKDNQELDCYFIKDCTLPTESKVEVRRWFDEPGFDALLRAQYISIWENVSEENDLLYIIAKAFCIAMRLEIDFIESLVPKMCAKRS